MRSPGNFAPCRKQKLRARSGCLRPGTIFNCGSRYATSSRQSGGGYWCRITGKPTFHGQPPPWAQQQFVSAPPGAIPKFAKLPAPHERCPYSGASRSWLIDQAEAGNIRLVRVRQPGRMRGAVFLHVPSLLEFLRKQMEAQTPEVSGNEVEEQR